MNKCIARDPMVKTERTNNDESKVQSNINDDGLMPPDT